MLFQEYHSQLQRHFETVPSVLKEEKETSRILYIRDFKRELVIEFLEWYRNNGLV